MEYSAVGGGEQAILTLTTLTEGGTTIKVIQQTLGTANTPIQNILKKKETTSILNIHRMGQNQIESL